MKSYLWARRSAGAVLLLSALLTFGPAVLADEFKDIDAGLAALKRADQVLVLDHGEPVFLGSPPFDRTALERHLQV